MQRLVISWADQPSLKQCRIVNQAFEQMATRELFRGSPLARHLTSFRRAVNITSSRHMAFCVKSLIVYYAILLSEWNLKDVDGFSRRVGRLREGHGGSLLASNGFEQLDLNTFRFLSRNRSSSIK
jgi:hypothetical protein